MTINLLPVERFWSQHGCQNQQRTSAVVLFLSSFQKYRMSWKTEYLPPIAQQNRLLLGFLKERWKDKGPPTGDRCPSLHIPSAAGDIFFSNQWEVPLCGEPQLSSPMGPLIMTFLVKISAGWCPPPKKETSHGASDVLFLQHLFIDYKTPSRSAWPPVLCRSKHKQRASATARDSALLENSDSELDPNLLFDPGLVKAFMNTNLLVMIWRIIELK